ncbi:MAG TPA: hypothetical protein VFE90_18235 [Myxococcales bacterium]|jgi:hypothetical protein|nr:hypothetical protein [Myxococcales bacterium]
MHCKGLHRGSTAGGGALSTAALLLLAACGGMKDAGAVADKFVDRYYVESDQDSALPLTTGIARMRLQEELKLTREARQGNPGMQLRPVRVYYRRRSLDGSGAARAADYELDIRPQGGGALERGAHVELSQQGDGSWRVSNFSETQPR